MIDAEPPTLDLFRGNVTALPRPVDLQRCCERELAYRRRVYPRLIAKGTMSEGQAKAEIELMAACATHFRGLAERRA